MTIDADERRARERDDRARCAQAAAAHAFERLLALAEQRDSGQIFRVVRCLASTYNGEAFAFDLFELRAVAWFSVDRFRVTQTSASRPRRPAVLSLVRSNCEGLERALRGERQAIARRWKPSSSSQCAWAWPVSSCLGDLPTRSVRRLRMNTRWFRKNCNKLR